ncbi:hypothetical protein TcasGA2_TC001810 [Tribolium castaneum]|uniref:Uncharacterized protein n=1 Tax=Tribolium castaneum TaxID=7070 RepID=D7EKJ2_TRICA|nr:hypothetical protein TcasGA2_TC001810 [Tribolium castaneum]
MPRRSRSRSRRSLSARNNGLSRSKSGSRDHEYHRERHSTFSDSVSQLENAIVQGISCHGCNLFGKQQRGFTFVPELCVGVQSDDNAEEWIYSVEEYAVLHRWDDRAICNAVLNNTGLVSGASHEIVFVAGVARHDSI